MTPDQAFTTINALAPHIDAASPEPARVWESLDCPECGADAFVRDVGLWYDGEEEACDCGARLRVSLEEDFDEDGDEDGGIAMVATASIVEEDGAP